MRGNWSETIFMLRDAVAKHGGYVAPSYVGDAMSTQTTDQCSQILRRICTPGNAPQGPHMYTIWYDKIPSPHFGVRARNAPLDMAYFLLARGPHAWIGSGKILGWSLSHWWSTGKEREITISDFRPHELFDADYGEPVSQCVETVPYASGVFVRGWTNVNVTVDCGNMRGHIARGPLPPPPPPPPPCAAIKHQTQCVWPRCTWNTTARTCGVTPWSHCTTGKKVWMGDVCPRLETMQPGVSWEDCKDRCVTTTNCTVFDFHEDGDLCGPLYGCPIGTEPNANYHGSVGYAVYPLKCGHAVSSTPIQTDIVNSGVYIK